MAGDRAAALRKLEAARVEDRKWRHELTRKERQLEQEKHKGRARLEEEQQRYELALTEERRAAHAVQRELASEEQRHRTLSLEVSALRGMVSAAQAELGELEERMGQEETEEAAALIEQQRGYKQRLPAPVTTAGPSSSLLALAAPSAAVVLESSLVLIINLDRRSDRLDKVLKMPWGLAPTRLPAIDGNTLTWDGLVADGKLSEAAAADSRWAEERKLPTVCRETGSFSPHLTLSGVGCALSHRACWERLASHPTYEWALIAEDDVDGLAPSFEAQLQSILRQLPRSWMMCYLGYHESSSELLPARSSPTLMEPTGEGSLTGLFGYLMRKSAAKTLLEDETLFPLRHQIDVALAQRKWPKGSRFALAPDAVLLTSPRSEDGACDTDVQTLGEPGVVAHSQVPVDWLKAAGAKLLA